MTDHSPPPSINTVLIEAAPSGGSYRMVAAIVPRKRSCRSAHERQTGDGGARECRHAETGGCLRRYKGVLENLENEPCVPLISSLRLLQCWSRFRLWYVRRRVVQRPVRLPVARPGLPWVGPSVLLSVRASAG